MSNAEDVSVLDIRKELRMVRANRKNNQSILEANAEFVKGKMQAHTNQTLNKLKEELLEMDTERWKGLATSLVTKESIISLIDEAINE